MSFLYFREETTEKITYTFSIWKWVVAIIASLIILVAFFFATLSVNETAQIFLLIVFLVLVLSVPQMVLGEFYKDRARALQSKGITETWGKSFLGKVTFEMKK